MSFSKMSDETRHLIYSHLTPDYETKVFDIKQICTDDNDDGEDEHDSAYLNRINYEMRNHFLVPYLKQFEGIIERGGTGDYVDYNIYNVDAFNYFLRSGIIHFANFTCDYETGYDYESEAGKFASGKIEVWVDEDGEVQVSDNAQCDGESWYGHEWEWFIGFERGIKQWVKADECGLIDWDLMEYIDGALESEIEASRARSGGEDEEMSESGGTNDESEVDNESSSDIAANDSENESDASCTSSVEDEEDEK
jgi:hypothetical protein